MLKVRLLESATAESLALGRILVFATWIVYVLVDPVSKLSLLPIDLFHPHGVFVVVPDSFWAAVLTPAGLLGYKALAIAAFAWAGLGFKGARVVTGVAIVLAMVYLQIKKGFGGHWDHREMTLVYITGLLLLTPAWDALAVHRSPRAGARREGIYRATLLFACFIIIVQYVFVGAARLFIGAPGVFMDGTLQKWIENRNLRPNPFGFEVGTLFLDPFWSLPLDLLFLGGTVLEFVIIALLFLPARWLWLKVLFIIAFVTFHTSIFVLMNVAFPEDVVLLLLFFDMAVPLRRMRRGHTVPGTLRVDPANARAVRAAGIARERSSRLAFETVPGVEGGLEFVADDGARAYGEQALTEAIHRQPGWLWLAVARTAARRRGPLRAERGPVATWFFGPLAEAGVSRPRQ